MITADKKKVRIFISYSSKDEVIAEYLHEAIEKAGFEVWRDRTRLETDWSREIAFALTESDIICVIWSEYSNISSWVKHEWLTARALGKPIIPCLTANAPSLPKPLANILSVKIPSANDLSAKLEERIQTQLRTSAKYDYTTLPPNSFIPFTPNPHFVGRDLDLLTLYLNMIGNLNKIGIAQLGCIGMAGSGKTQLAVEFAYRFAYAFEGVYWVQAANQDEWINEFVCIARQRLRLREDDPTTPVSEDDYIFALQRFLKEHPDFLIIMDNVAAPLQLNSERSLRGNVTPLTIGCNLLFTSQRRSNLPGVIIQSLDVLPRNAAYELITINRKPDTPEEKQNALQICDSVGFLPLALVLISGYLNKYRSVSFTDYYEELLANRLSTIDLSDISAAELSTRHETAVTLTLNSQFAALKDVNAKKILFAMALFPEANIVPQARLILFSGVPSRNSKIDRPAEKAILLLVELNLIEFIEKEKALRLHPLIYSYLHGSLGNEDLRSAKDAALHSLSSLFKDLRALYFQYTVRGIDNLIEDFNIGLSWTDSRTDAFSPLKQLTQILDRERGNLRYQSEERVFFQQLHYRIKVIRLEKLASVSRSVLTSLGQNTIITRSTSKTSDDAVIRTLKIDDPDFMDDNPRIVRFSTNGSYAIAGCWKKIRYFDIATGRVISTGVGYESYIMDVQFYNEDKGALSVYSDGTFIFWELEKGSALRELVPANDRIRYMQEHYRLRAAAIDRSAGYVIMAYGNKEGNSTDTPKEEINTFIVILNIETDNIEYEVRHDGWVNEVSLDHSSGYAFFGDATENILIFWDLKADRSTKVYSNYVYKHYKVNGISKIVTGRERDMLLVIVNGGITIWDRVSKQYQKALEGDSFFVNDVDLSPDGKYVLAGIDKTLFLWDLNSGKLIRKFTGHSSTVDCVAFSPDGSMALSGSDRGLILWRIDYVSKSTISHSHREAVTNTSLSSNGRYALTSSDDCLILWNVLKGKALETIAYPEADHDILEQLQIDDQGKFTNDGSFLMHFPTALDVSISPDGDLGALALTEGAVMLIKFHSDQEIIRLGFHDGPATVVHFSPDGRYLLSGSYDGTLILWDIVGRSTIKTFIIGEGKISSVSVSPEGDTIACGCSNGTVLLIDFHTGNTIKKIVHGIDQQKRYEFFEFNGAGENVYIIHLLNGGQKAVVSFTDNVPVLLDFEKESITNIYEGHTHVVSSLSLNRKKNMLVSADPAGILLLWDLYTGKILNKMIFDGRISSSGFEEGHIVIGDSKGQVTFLQLNE